MKKITKLTAQNEKKKELVPLSLKYKPKTLDEVRGRDDIIKSIRLFLKQGYVPNMFFYGIQGTGKTLIANLLLREYLGKQYHRRSYLVIDASMNNTVAYMKSQIVDFMKTSSMMEGKKKVLILDEADEMSSSAQAAVRRPLEKSMKNCLVIMLCNYPNKIIEPLKSRFTGFKFGAIPKKAIVELVNYVVSKEKINITDDYDHVVDLIYKYGKGEIRYILNNFMEHARSRGILDQSVIDIVASENTTFARLLFSGNVEKAIERAMQDPRGSINGAMTYVLESKDLSLSYKSRVKLMGWFSDALVNLSNNVPYYAVIRSVSHKVKSALLQSNKTKATSKK